VAEYFERGKIEAAEIAVQVGKSVATWKKEAAKIGIPAAEHDRMASAFEQEDLNAATFATAKKRS
jgi:hypothetical protein